MEAKVAFLLGYLSALDLASSRLVLQKNYSLDRGIFVNALSMMMI